MREKERSMGGLERERERERETETETERERHRDRETERDTERERDRDTERQRERQRERVEALSSSVVWTRPEVFQPPRATESALVIFFFLFLSPF